MSVDYTNLKLTLLTLNNCITIATRYRIKDKMGNEILPGLVEGKRCFMIAVDYYYGREAWSDLDKIWE